MIPPNQSPETAFLAAIRIALDELRLAKCRDDIGHTHCETCKIRFDAEAAYAGLADLLARRGDVCASAEKQE